MQRRRLFLGLCLIVAWPAAARTPSGQPATGAAYELGLSPAAAWLQGPGGVRLLELAPELLLSLTDPAASPASRPQPLRTQRLRFTPWQVKQRAGARFLVQCSAGAGPLRYRLELEGEPGVLELRLRSEAVQTTGVRVEVLRLQSGPSLEAAVVDRGLHWTTLRGPAFAGLLDAQRFRLGRDAAQLTVTGGPGLQGLWLRPLAEGRSSLELELDHEANHPFRPLLACTRRSRAVKHGSLDLTLRPAGSVRQLSAWLLLGDVSLPLVARFPRGAQAALTLTDHADQSTAAKLEALAFGATGAVAAGRLGPAYPGLVNRGLSYTKSVFVRRVPGYAEQLDGDTYRALVDRLQKSGVELGLHSVSGGLDRRERLRRLLPTFRAVSSGKTWIDHQPATNCEALSNQGWDPRSRYHSLDLLVEAGLRHFWSGEDIPAPRSSLNLLWPERAGRPRPLLYPFALRAATTRGEELWLFASSPFFLDRVEVVDALREEALVRLEREHGLFIGHVYLDTFQRPGGRFARRSLLQFGDGPGRYRLRPEVDAAFQRLAAHQAGGRLWVCGVDALVEFLSGRAAVELRPGQRPGELLLVSHAPRPLHGLTLRLPSGVVGRVSVDGSPPLGERQIEGGQRQIWFDLGANATSRVRLGGHFVAPAPLSLREAPHD